jgi:hypothetical protein
MVWCRCSSGARSPTAQRLSARPAPKPAST